MDFTFTETSLVLVGVTTGVVQVIKMAGWPKNWAPLMALVIGVSLAFVMKVDFAFVQGLIIGLASMGLWSGGKTINKGIQ